MRESIGSTFTLNIIILFIIVVFGILSATLSYYKAFKVNNRILDAIEQYEGYNQPAKDEIDRILLGFGYPGNSLGDSCAETNGNATLAKLSDNPPGQLYCVYYHRNEVGNKDDERTGSKNKKNKDNEPVYYNYSVVTYIYIKLPIVGEFKVPVYTKGERTYNFSCKTCTADGKCTLTKNPKICVNKGNGGDS